MRTITPVVEAYCERRWCGAYSRNADLYADQDRTEALIKALRGLAGGRSQITLQGGAVIRGVPGGEVLIRADDYTPEAREACEWLLEIWH